MPWEKFAYYTIFSIFGYKFLLRMGNRNRITGQNWVVFSGSTGKFPGGSAKLPVPVVYEGKKRNFARNVKFIVENRLHMKTHASFFSTSRISAAEIARGVSN